MYYKKTEEKVIAQVCAVVIIAIFAFAAINLHVLPPLDVVILGLILVGASFMKIWVMTD